MRSIGDVRVTKTVQALQVKVPESFIDPKDFSQFEGVGNIAGKVVSVDDIIGGAGAQLPKRGVNPVHGSYEYAVNFIGAMASSPPQPGASILVHSVKLATYLNILSLETTRLSFWSALRAVVPEPQGDERPRKALRSDIPEVALADLENASGDSAVLVIAVVTKVSVEALDSRVSFASNSMKFAVGLSSSCDSADEVLVDWWSNDGAFKQMVGNWQWLDMWEKCEGEDGRKAGGR